MASLIDLIAYQRDFQRKILAGITTPEDWATLKNYPFDDTDRYAIAEIIVNLTTEAAQRLQVDATEIPEHLYKMSEATCLDPMEKVILIGGIRRAKENKRPPLMGRQPSNSAELDRCIVGNEGQCLVPSRQLTRIFNATLERSMQGGPASRWNTFNITLIEPSAAAPAYPAFKEFYTTEPPTPKFLNITSTVVEAWLQTVAMEYLRTISKAKTPQP